MANWLDIYTEDEHWCCKVPSNSIYYSRPERLSMIETAVRNMPGDSLFGINTRYSSVSYSYKNTKFVEELQLTFYPRYERYNIDTYGGHIRVDLNYNKKTKEFHCKMSECTSVAESEKYIKENLKWTNETVIPANEILDDLSGFITNILQEYQDCFLQYYKKYQNNNNEFMLEYMDKITELTEKSQESGLKFTTNETGDKGYQLTLMCANDDSSKLVFYTEPCKLYTARGLLDYMMKFCKIHSTVALAGIPEMFKMIDNIIDCWNVATEHLDGFRALFNDSLNKDVNVAED